MRPQRSAAHAAVPHHRGRAHIGAILHRWHRRIGIAAALFLIWLALTGVLLNESPALGLDRTRIGWPWLMHWYGLQASVPTQGYVAAGHALVVLADGAVLDGHPLQPPISAPLGMVAAQGLLYVATAHSLILLQPDGRRVDELQTLPVATVQRIGSAADGSIAIAGSDGSAGSNGSVYVSSDGDSWTASAGATPQWSQPQPLSPAQRSAAAQVDRPSLPLQRVLADAHSGRLFGRYGPVVIDLVAAAACLLSLSGLWMVQRALHRQRAQRSPGRGHGGGA
jgi:hypothetical protein